MKQKSIFTTFIFMVMVLVLAACTTVNAAQPVRPGQIPELIIKASDYAFEAPDRIEAGLVSITLINDGQEPHHAQLVRLNDGVTMEQFQAASQQGDAAALSLISLAGGPGVIDPGLSGRVTVELTPGQYLLMCFVPGHDGVPHVAKGMVRPIEVVAATEQAAANSANLAQPKADGTVKLMDFSFVLPSEIKAGKQLWEVVNEGAQPHEILLIKLAEGKTMADVQAFIEHPHGTPPFANIGGFQAINPGQSGWLELDLQPGTYVALCHVPDPASGHAHLELGMMMPFTVK